MRSHRPILWVLLAAFIAGVAGVLLAVAGVSVWDVEARGEHLLPYPEKVLRVRILETATVYFDAERPGPSDILTGITLACGGAVVLFTWWLVRTTVARRRAWFFLLAGLGLTYLGVDDLFGAHETFGHNLRFLADLPGVDRPDDVVLALFLAPAAVFLWAYRAELRRAPTEALLLAGAVALFGLAIVGDLLGAPVEEPSEVASALLATAAFVRICAGELRLTTSLTPGAARR